MQNRQKASLHVEGPRVNRLTGFSSAPVVFLCWSNYHIQFIILLMRVINQVLLPNLWISSSLQYTGAGHTGWQPDVSSFEECNCELVCKFACSSKLHSPTPQFCFCQDMCVLSTEVSNCYYLQQKL